MRHQPSPSCPARGRALAAKTKRVFGAMSKVFKHADDKAFTRHALDVPSTSAEDLGFEGFYPAPFTQTFTSASQLSGSTGSTPRSSVLFSRHTSQTNITVPELRPSWDKTTAPPQIEARVPNSQVTAGRTKGPFISILEEEEDDGCGEAHWGEYDSDDDDMLCIHRKRHAPPYNGLATSLVHNPYAAFLFQPSYKSPYLFPRAHRSVNAYYS